MLKIGKKTYLILALTFLLGFMFPLQVGAKEIKDEFFNINGTVKLTNLVTGEVQEAELTNINQKTACLGGNNYEQSIETTFKFPAQISPLTNQGGDRDNGDVYAKVSLNYDYLKNSNQIRINTLSGYWTPLNNFILIDNRKTGCHNEVPYGSSITKYPTSNTFSYNTGWGYVDFYPGSLISGARAYSEARVIIPGMGSGYIFKLDFFLQNP